MSDNFLVLALVALLPLSAGVVVLQTNPYRALVVRGVLGAIAALTYTLFGAADIALTEALVGTMLSIALYAIAVRSSMTMKIGVLESDLSTFSETMLSQIRLVIAAHHLRPELFLYPSPEALKAALVGKEVHTICERSHPFSLSTRVNHLYRILHQALPPTLTTVSYTPVSPSQQKSHFPNLSTETPT